VDLEDVAVLHDVVLPHLEAFDLLAPQAGPVELLDQVLVDQGGDVLDGLAVADGEGAAEVGRLAGDLGVDPDHAQVLEEEGADVLLIR
jgi:hypothetical protein